MTPPAQDQLPASLIQRFALYAFEIVEGYRSAAHLASWLSADVVDKLKECRSGRSQLRSLCGDGRRTSPTPGPVHQNRPRPGIIEAVVVLSATARAIAVALRFEFLRGRWLATEVTVL